MSEEQSSLLAPKLLDQVRRKICLKHYSQQGRNNQRALHPQGVGRGCKANESATTTHRRMIGAMRCAYCTLLAFFQPPRRIQREVGQNPIRPGALE